MHTLDRDTALEREQPGRFRAGIDTRWWVVDGPNGGFIAALILRAMTEAAGDPDRSPRSLTVHYTSRPREGPAEIDVQVERRGRSLTTLTARMSQDGALRALALGALSTPRDGHEFVHASMPVFPPPEELPREVPRIPIHERFDYRFVPDASPGSGTEEARTAAWIRPAEPRALDPLLLAAYSDALPPALFARATEMGQFGPVPTVDLTIHFRRDPAALQIAPDAFCLAVFRSRVAHQGYIEEDGEIWARDGTLLAHSRQLAVVLGARDGAPGP